MSNFAEKIAYAVRDFVKKKKGEVFWVKKAITSSAIVANGVDLTAVSIGGDLAVEDIVVKTGGVGLAGGTTIKVICDNANGTETIFLDLVANLGTGGKTSTLEIARQRHSVLFGSQTFQQVNAPTVLESGKKLTLETEGGVGTGAGTVDVWMKFRKVDDASSIEAA